MTDHSKTDAEREFAILQETADMNAIEVQSKYFLTKTIWGGNMFYM